MEVSVPDSSGTGLYLSKNMKLATLRDNIYGDLSGHLVSDYGLKHANGTRLSLSGQANTISNIRDGNVRFNGLKEFTQYPYISSDYPSVFSRYGGREEYIIPNVGHVQWMIKERNPVCVSTTSSYIADGCPFRNSNDAVLSDDT